MYCLDCSHTAFEEVEKDKYISEVHELQAKVHTYVHVHTHLYHTCTYVYVWYMQMCVVLSRSIIYGDFSFISCNLLQKNVADNLDICLCITVQLIPIPTHNELIIVCRYWEIVVETRFGG